MRTIFPGSSPPDRPRAGRTIVGCVLVVGFVLLPGRPLAAPSEPGPSIAFFYGRPLPLEGLASFDQVVVEPENTTAEDIEALNREKVELFAYLSVGEVHERHPLITRVDPAFQLGKNEAWGSVIVDPASEAWRELLLERVGVLRARGYRGLFLDTMDAYEAVVPVGKRLPQVAGLLSFLRAVRAQYPGTRVILNRGFALFPDAAPLVAGLAAESMFASFDPGRKTYGDVSANDRAWLDGQLRIIRDRHRLPVTVIDYVPAKERARARDVARRIVEQGYVPWVSQPALDQLGVGLVESQPRRVLAAYDGSKVSSLVRSHVHRYMAMPLEHFGLAIDYLDVSGPLPAGSLTDRYVALVTWFTDDEVGNGVAFREWLVRQIESGLRVAILGRLGFSPDTPFLGRLGIMAANDWMRIPARVQRQDDLVGFEAAPWALGRGVYPWRAVGKDIVAHIEVVDDNGTRATPIVTGPWGGMALSPYVLEPGHEGHSRWILDPFKFIARALALPPMPMMDVTTENGRRIFSSHIDGDGFVSLAETPARPYSGQVILDEILKVYRVPTTVSVIEGEVGPAGLYPEQSKKLEAIARAIFRMPHVEVASHAYSHPFNWSEAAKGAAAKPDSHLPIPGYVVDLRREIAGSIAYINSRLTAANKPVRVFLWSGDALPNERALEITKEVGVYNVNGETAGLASPRPTVTDLSATGRPVGRQFQVYAPVQNETLYTNLWRGPFYGYRRAMDTLALSETPRRLKPISLYYHFYSGSKPAALEALKRVYEWGLEQEVFPTFVSLYARKVEEFQRVRVARTLDGGWELRGLGGLRTARIDPNLGWPDFNRSRGVVGVRDLPQGRYVSFLPESKVRLYLSDKPADEPHLVWANAELREWKKTERQVTFRLWSKVPIKMAVGGCASMPEVAVVRPARGKGQVIRPVRARAGEGIWEMELSEKETGSVKLACR